MRLTNEEKNWIELLIKERLLNIAKQVHQTESKDDAIYIIQKTAFEYEVLNKVLAKLGA